ncbi:hypothetical protein EP331_12410 [bacterium]|nr:MAG: hypothetical protein EP331_12410 [bacterium]
MNLNKQKKQHSLANTLNEFAQSNGYEISEMESCGDYSIGVDAIQKVLFFVKRIESESKPQLIELNTIKSARLLRNSSSITINTDAYKAIGKIDIRLSPLEAGKPDVNLEFYNVHVNPQLSGELQSAERWVNSLNNLLK